MIHCILQDGEIFWSRPDLTEVSTEAGGQGSFGYLDREMLQCDAGYVLTGMKLKTLDGEEGKMITGVRIKCTKLLEK